MWISKYFGSQLFPIDAAIGPYHFLPEHLANLSHDQVDIVR